MITVAETRKHIPFDIKRVFYLYDFQGIKTVRGNHAHRSSEQVIFCIRGSFKLLLDDGKNKEEIILNEPDTGVFIGKMVWSSMYDFSEDCVLLVISSAHYDDNEYIRNYDLFLKEKRLPR